MDLAEDAHVADGDNDERQEVHGAQAEYGVRYFLARAVERVKRHALVKPRDVRVPLYTEHDAL